MLITLLTLSLLLDGAPHPLREGWVGACGRWGILLDLNLGFDIYLIFNIYLVIKFLLG